MSVYTIGCSTNTLEQFLELLKRHNINCIVDVRSTPFSKYASQFNRETLQRYLNENNILYIWMGKEFGARRDDRSLYSVQRYLDFEKVRKDNNFLSGVQRIKKGISKGYKISLMCTEKEPIDCHRAILVAKGLEENDVEVKHILQSSKLITQKQLEEQLLDRYFKDRNQINFDMILGSSKTEEEMIEEAYKKRNKDIGYEIGGEDNY